MKKITLKIISFAALLCILLPMSASILPANAEETPPAFGTIAEILESYETPNGRPMSCAHRANVSASTTLPENSLLSIRACIEAGVDIVELDISRTKDGVYVLSHDDTITRCTTYSGSQKISDMTFETVCKYSVLSGAGGNTEVFHDENGETLALATLPEALGLCRGHCMINLDKFESHWDYRMEIYEIVRDAECLDLVMFKGAYDTKKVAGWFDEIKKQYGEDADLPHFCTKCALTDNDAYLSYLNAHADGKTADCVESNFSDFSAAPANPEVSKEITRKMRKFANVLGDSDTHCARLPDDVTGWSAVISLGFNILQTNYGAELASYIRTLYGNQQRDVSEKTDARFFSDYTHDGKNTTVSLTGNAVYIKNGDTLAYKGLDFGEKPQKFVLETSGTIPDGALELRADSPDAEPFARIAMNGSANALTLWTELDGKISGKHDLFITAAGLSETDTVALSFFAVTNGNFGKTVGILDGNFYTTAGVIPELPEKVMTVTELGYVQSAQIDWCPIPAQCVSHALDTFRLPGKLVDSGETVWANVTVLPFDTKDMLVWFDAGHGLTYDGDGNVKAWASRVGGVTANSVNAPEALSVDADGDGNTDFCAVSFDGKNDYMTFDLPINGMKEITLVLQSATEKTTTEYYKDFLINNTARYTLLCFPQSDSWGSVWLTAFKDAITCRFGSGVKDNRGAYYTGVDIDGFSSIAAVKNGTEENLYLNSGLIYERASDTLKEFCMGDPGEAIANTANTCYLGVGFQNDQNWYYEGSVSDIMIFSRALDSREIEALDDYLAAKRTGTLHLNDLSDFMSDTFEQYLKRKEQSGEKTDGKGETGGFSGSFFGTPGGRTVRVIVICACAVIIGTALTLFILRRRKNDE